MNRYKGNMQFAEKTRDSWAPPTLDRQSNVTRRLVLSNSVPCRAGRGL
jgi:hypothetical protein